MRKDKVSIIVPVYNVEKYIITCLESIAHQTYDNIECIIVDDCGKDHSIQLAENFISSYNGSIKFVVCYREKNGGLSAARNSGLKMASGRFVYFLDSDDVLYFNSIGILVEKIGIAQMCIGSYSTINEENVGLSFNDKVLLNKEYGNRKDVAKSYTQNSWPVMAWNKLILRTFIESNNLYFEEGLIHEDELWNFHVLSCIERVSTVSSFTYKYRQRQGSIMTTENPKNRKDLVIILQRISTSLYSTKDDVLYDYFQSVFYYVCLSVFTNRLLLSTNYLFYKEMTNLPIKMKPRNTVRSRILSKLINSPSRLNFIGVYTISAMTKIMNLNV
ncbi:glycosyltransferase [Bacteroides sp. BFG-551]|nr:glycosyltransferase [Bacteroides sp. BFG-551]